ncbi:MAG: hypothetical protein RIR79_2033 [Pseudomonadota bacterium]|jgi:prophage regulatory protein
MVILRLDEVMKVLGHRSKASIYNQIRDGLFTKGVLIGHRARGWPDYEVDAILKARIAGQSEEQIRELVKKLHANRLTIHVATEAPAPIVPIPAPKLQAVKPTWKERLSTTRLEGQRHEL